MAARNPSLSSYKLRSLAAVLCRHRVASGGGFRRSRRTYELGRVGSIDQGPRFLCGASGKHNEPKFEMENGESREMVRSAAAPLPAPPKFGIANWIKFYLGSILSLLLPLWTNKQNNMLLLEGEATKIVEEIEVAATVVDKVATTADNVFSEVAKQLPEDSKLKEAAEAMELVSSLVAHDAQLVEDIIHKVGDVKQDLEELDTMVEKVIKGKGSPNN